MANRPNVVFLLTDDQGPWAMGCAGNEEIRTPNLDRLADEGTRMENFFCASPVCSPARASILTGRIPSQHGVHDWIRDRDDKWYLPGHDRAARPVAYLDGLTAYTDVLAGQGYTCGLSGKWHLGDSMTPQHGFTHWFCHPKGGGSYNDMPMIRKGEIVPTEGYITDCITDDALAFLETQSRQASPFYLSVHYTAPHSPWINEHPREVVDSYDDCPFKSCPQEAMHPWAAGLSRHSLGNREALKGYFAAVTAMDANVGRILAKLDALGIADETLVVFLSDNGYSCGHHGFWGKGNGTLPLNMYENSIKVPMLARHPGVVPAGRICRAMASQYDILPTLLGYLDLPAVEDASLPGRSFLPALLGESDEAREDVVVYDEYGPVRMIRTQEWKYVHRYPGGPHELYNLTDDLAERRNLADDKEQRPVVEEMRRRLARWFERYVDPARDGARFDVQGGGQMARIDGDCCGEEAFFRRDR